MWARQSAFAMGAGAEAKALGALRKRRVDPPLPLPPCPPGPRRAEPARARRRLKGKMPIIGGAAEGALAREQPSCQSGTSASKEALAALDHVALVRFVRLLMVTATESSCCLLSHTLGR